MTSIEREIAYMREALKQAQAAAKLGEVPVGCVIVLGDETIAAAHNLRESRQNALAHAEMLAIGAACEKLGSWRLPECELYVTLEPCPMCMGAVINSRIGRVVYGTRDPKAGVLGSLVDLTAIPFNHKPQVQGGICEIECGQILKEFFSRLRASH
ncbi:MAG: nucleoside deaminase [Oscillospiraceae bacterium]|nr:nucleoside deaminase [Oscillospiraceae bacterium]